MRYSDSAWDNIKGTLCYIFINCSLMHMKAKGKEETYIGHEDANVNYKFSNIHIYIYIYISD